MDHRKQYDFSGQLKYEHIQFFFRRHWTHFLRPVFFTLPLGLMIFFLLFVIGKLITLIDIQILQTVFAFMTMLITIVFIYAFYLQFINYFFDLVIATDCRIIITRKTLFLRNDYDAIDLTKIQDIAVEAHGLWRNYLQYGKLTITLSTAAPPLVIAYVPNPHFYLERINRIKREHILQRQERRATKPNVNNEDKPVEYLQDVHKLSGY